MTRLRLGPTKRLMMQSQVIDSTRELTYKGVQVAVGMKWKIHVHKIAWLEKADGCGTCTFV